MVHLGSIIYTPLVFYDRSLLRGTSQLGGRDSAQVMTDSLGSVVTW